MDKLLLTMEKEEVNREEFERHLIFWKSKLEGNLPELSLPYNFPKNNRSEFVSKTYTYIIPNTTIKQIKAFLKLENVTSHIFFMTIFKILMFRYSSEEDVLVGTIFSSETDQEKKIAKNTTVLRTLMQEDMTFLEALHEVKTVIQEALNYQSVPFNKIASEITQENSQNRNPFFQVMMNMGNKENENWKRTDFSLGKKDIRDQYFLPVELHLKVVEESDKYKCSITYNTSLFTQETIVRMEGHLNNLIEGSILAPETKISLLPLLTDSEKHQLFIEWNRPKVSYPRNSTIPQLFEEQVELNPYNVALIFEDKEITFKELNLRANKIANYLKELKIKQNQLVALYLDRTPDLVASFLGVLKAGGAYVPIDLSYPRERIEYMLDDSKVSFVITTGKNAKEISNKNVEIICLDLDEEVINKQLGACNYIGSPESLAYVMYTSGSTGKPKGVEVMQRGIIRLVKNNNSYASLGPKEIILNRASVAFDVSAFEIYGALLNGGKLVLMNSHKPSFEQIASTIQQNRVTLLRVGPDMLNVLLEDYCDHLGSLRQVFSGGEVLPVWLAQKFLAKLKRCKLTNAYGPTENTVNTTSYHVKEIKSNISSIPIGRPIANDRVYILDQHLQPVPIGVIGDLYISGDGMARGYLNRPDLTKERFVPNPFTEYIEDRMYKSGDLARFREDGNIEFIGRSDDQVKIRGVRIELGEIEAVIGQFPEIRQTVTTTFIAKDGLKELVAYVVMNNNKRFNQQELRAFVREKLPAYMVPTFFVELQEIPVTPVGKLDRKKLPSPTMSFKQTDHILPRNPVETKLVSIWQSLLDVKPIGVKDNFFDLGGNSLMAMRLFSEIENTFNKRLPVSIIFHEETIENLAKLISTNNQSDIESSSLVAIQSNGTKTPLFCVHGGGGEVLIYKELAVALGDNQPVYGLRYVKNEDLQKISVEAMAEKYIKQIKKIQPQGPYNLLGFCYGGAIAYEMAHRLLQDGKDVSLTVINFVNPGFVQTKTSLSNLVINKMRRLYNMPVKETVSLISRKINNVFNLSNRPVISRGENSEVFYNNSSTSNEIKKAINEYKPRPYPGKMVLIRGINYDRYEDKLGWEHTADGNINVSRIFAPHDLMLKKPNVERVVKQIKNHLA
jgi:amino acid adenylation domain-containing protein